MLVNFILVPSLARIPRSIGTLGLSCLFQRQIVQQTWIEKTNEIIENKKNIFLVENEQNWEEVLPRISRDVASVNALGFDTEWIVKNNKRNPIALLQLATYTGNCFVVRLNRLQSIPPSLRDILENRKILKVGVSCATDDRFMTQDYNVDVRGCLDLRHLMLEDGVQDIGFSLGSLASYYLARNLNKNWKLKASNWESNTLAQIQVTYAAEDALVGLHILFAQLRRLWNPVLQENWETSMCKAIEEVCEPFVENDFVFTKKDVRYKNKNEDGVMTQYNNDIGEDLCRIETPDGQFLNHCNKKKALWYIDKGIGELVSSNPLVVKLKVEPSGRPKIENADVRLYLRNRPNNCVVCGKEDSHVWKNVIPYEFRKYFPDKFLSHIYDVVVLCNQCLRTCNSKDNELREILAKEYDEQVDYSKVTMNERLKIAKSAGVTLKNGRSQLPPEQVQLLEKTLMEYFETDTLSENLITQAANLDTQNLIEESTAKDYKIFKHYEKIGLVHLETRCRQWFLDSVKPKYMHKLWSVSHNHDWLIRKISGSPVGSEIHNDFKMALVGTEGEIDVPYQSKTIIRKTNVCNPDSNTSSEGLPKQSIDQNYVKR